MINEFKEFAMKGNMIDLAVGLIMGTAFGTIVTSLVNDVLMPPIGLLLGKVNFSNLFINLSATSYPSLEAAKAAGAPTINYGLFINAVINFLIVSIAMFLIIRAMNRMRKPAASAPVADTKDCPYCLSKVPREAKRCAYCTSDL